jgi:hypothetical protein
MRRGFNILIACVMVLVTLGLWALALTWRPSIREIDVRSLPPFEPALVKKGADLAALGDCNTCHTVPGGDAYAGGLALPTPFGTIYSTNIRLMPRPESAAGRRRHFCAPCARALIGKAGISIPPFLTTISPSSRTRTTGRSTLS